MTGSDTGVQLVVPHRVEIAGGDLLAEATMPEYRAAKAAAFYDFASLDPNDNAAICEFARRWGTMGLCAEHGLPVGHYMARGVPDSRSCFPRQVTKNGVPFYSEPLIFWRHAIVKAAALRRIGSSIATLGKGRREDWLTVHAPVEGSKPWNEVQLARSLLAGQVQAWLDLGAVRPQFYWDHKQRRWAVRHAVPREVFWPLFGWLGLRLMIDISGGRVTVCPYCQTEYFPQRLPGSQQDHCCGKTECKRAYFTNHKRKQRAK